MSGVVDMCVWRAGGRTGVALPIRRQMQLDSGVGCAFDVVWVFHMCNSSADHVLVVVARVGFFLCVSISSRKKLPRKLTWRPGRRQYSKRGTLSE